MTRRGCRKCPAGTSRIFYTGPCRPCRNGRYSARGESFCSVCAGETSAKATGGVKCVPFTSCPRGFVAAERSDSDYAAGTCISLKTGCPKGRFPLKVTMGMDENSTPRCRSRNGAMKCPIGTVPNGAECLRCSKGSGIVRRMLNGKIVKICRRCRNGFVSNGRAPFKCTRCVAPTHPDDDMATCVCDLGNVGVRDGKCINCPTVAGKWKDTPMGCLYVLPNP